MSGPAPKCGGGLRGRERHSRRFVLVDSMHRMAHPVRGLTTVLVLLQLGVGLLHGETEAVPLPAGVRAVWDLEGAHRERTSTRDRLCLNGLWRWQPADTDGQDAPQGGWGYFKVPGPWPGITDYMQKESQTVIVHPSWRDRRLGEVNSAWYEREIAIPAEWVGRRIAVGFEYLNSYAVVHVDGRRVGEARFPGGEVELTGACRPGSRHRLSVWVAALPLQAVLRSYTDSASAREVKGAVARRGLCGDVFLTAVPTGPRVIEVNVDTSVRRREIRFGSQVRGMVPGRRYDLRARVKDPEGRVRRWVSRPFTSEDLDAEGRWGFTEKWMPRRLWDVDTPGNLCEVEVAVGEVGGPDIDRFWPQRFGFREFWIQGRDFLLNGLRLQLSAVPLDNAQVSAGTASYAAARESLERLQSFGINFVYTHNYGCEPGSHLGFSEILRAADDTGMLVGFSQPHFSHYPWTGEAADRENGYFRHAAFYVRAARNHPSVVLYAMSHNATGYHEDMNPDLIDGVQAPRDSWATKNAELARRAEAIVRRLDPSRPVYHHASGNLGALHAINFYPNFVPIQEMSDWFGHWATRGVKPVFLCEYGAPFSWDWTLYRGWYRGVREFGSARVPWEFCLAEWNAQFVGDAAFPAGAVEKANLRWEAEQFRAGRVWYRWDYPAPVGSTRFDERYPIFAAYLTDNWRAFRTLGVSGISPWEHEHFWRLRPGVDRSPKTLPVDWEGLQRPGFSPDYERDRYERMDLAYDRSAWQATPAAEALLRNNRPLLAYLGGGSGQVTAKDHLVTAGEALQKQIVILNNSRRSAGCSVEWRLELPRPLIGRKRVRVGAGGEARVPLRLELPASLGPGRYDLTLRVHFEGGEIQEDRFAITVVSPPVLRDPGVRIAAFDPRGETLNWLRGLGLAVDVVDAQADLSNYDLLVVGRGALTGEGSGPDIRRVREGLRVLVFEQTAEALERRLGFRVAEYGLRQVFPRVPDHPILAGLGRDHLRDWRGAATLVAPRLNYTLDPRRGPTVRWCGLEVTRLWRCGNRGSVASVLIEKPARGDFLAVVDGGFGLQYSPLLEYREGAGLVIFCQLDVTGRTERDPAAETLGRNLLQYAASWRPAKARRAVYVGEPAGARHFEAVGIPVGPFTGSETPADTVLVVGTGGGEALVGRAGWLEDWGRRGGQMLAMGLTAEDLRLLPALAVELKRVEHISVGFAPFALDSPFAGIGPADLHNRDPREIDLIAGGASVAAGGLLAERGGVVFCQVAPWHFDGGQQMNLKRTHRRLAVVCSRLAANLGVRGVTPLLERFQRPVASATDEARWRQGFYLDQPEEWDDPYRFFRW